MTGKPELLFKGESCPDRTAGFQFNKKRRSANSHPATNQEWIDSGCRLATLRLECFLVSFRGELLCYGFLKLFSIHAVAFGGVHENVVATGGGSLIRRTQKADFEKEFAE